MNKILLPIYLILLVFSTTYVEAFKTCVVGSKSHYELGILFRSDQIKWNIHEDIQLLEPFVVEPSSSATSTSATGSVYASEGIKNEFVAQSDTKLSRLHIIGLRGEARNMWCDCFFTKFYGDLGWLYSGRGRERDFFVALPQPGPYISKNEVNGSLICDFAGAMGHYFELMQHRLHVGVLAGYAVNYQKVKYRAKRNIQDQISGPAQIAAGFTSGAGSNQVQALWYGPWLGMDASYDFCDGWNIYSEFEYHFPRCDRKKQSTTPFQGIAHRDRHVNGQGLNWKFGGRYYFCPDAFININWLFSHWRANKHHEGFEWRTVGIEMNTGYEF